MVMYNKKLLTIQDVSCVGQCSLTVALPILSACKIETCILPSAVLSTHTAGFSGFTFRDLTEDLIPVMQHWEKENITFGAVYTGYLGSKEQIDDIIKIVDSRIEKDGLLFVDPAMADNGKLYGGFNDEFVSKMKELCVKADFCIPNLTEACLLTGTEYKEDYDEEYISTLICDMVKCGIKNIVLTGIGFEKGRTGVVSYFDGEIKYYSHKKFEKGCHGTGDIYSSAFVGAYLNGNGIFRSTKIAADFTYECIKETKKDDSHWYGAKFEPVLYKLIKKI